MKKGILGLSACVFLLFAGVAMAGPVEVSGGLEITGTPGVDGVIFPDGTTQTSAVNGSLYQKRVTGTCSSGYAISAIDVTGGVVTCQPVDSGLAAGTYGNAYNFTNSSNTFTGYSVTATASGSAAGVSGSSTNAPGVYGTSSGSGNGNAGVYGSNTSDGPGVRGDSSSGYGVQGWGSSVGGVYGNSSNGTGVRGDGGTYGAWGNSASGTGVYGTGGAVGVRGETYSGYGVYGTATGGAAIYGSSSGAAYAGSFSGDVFVSGDLTASTKHFKIDHPLDPANKYLYHTSVESSDMKNIYDGVAVLDASGEVWVTLPDWFEALNKDFRYQLTSIGAPGPNLYIAEEIADNRFKIAGGRPNAKVSWMVTGIRQDAWANAHRIPVEEEKQGVERGAYIHPELFGQPRNMSIEYKRNPQLARELDEATKTEDKH